MRFLSFFEHKNKSSECIHFCMKLLVFFLCATMLYRWQINVSAHLVHAHFGSDSAKCPNVEPAIYGEELQLELNLFNYAHFFLSLVVLFVFRTFCAMLGVWTFFFTFYWPFDGHDNNEARKMSILDDLMAKWCPVLSLFEFNVKLYVYHSHVFFSSPCSQWSSWIFQQEPFAADYMKPNTSLPIGYWIYFRFYHTWNQSVTSICCCCFSNSAVMVHIDFRYRFDDAPPNYYWKRTKIKQLKVVVRHNGIAFNRTFSWKSFSRITEWKWVEMFIKCSLNTASIYILPLSIWTLRISMRVIWILI